MNVRNTMTYAATVATLAAVLAPHAHAQSPAGFFKGKTVEIVIGAAAGGGYDLAGRAVAQHIGRHIPGNPNVVVHNMPGAASMLMTNWLYNVAKRDGTAIGMPNNNVPLEPRLRLLSKDGSNIKFDVSKLNWVGSPIQEPQILFVWHTAPAKVWADLKTNKVVVGATSPAADAYTLQTLLNKTAGTRMDIVTGYKGQNSLYIAMERGEIQANSSGLSTLTVSRPHLLKENKVRILLQYGAARHPLIKDVPTALEVVPSEADKDLWRLYTLKYAFARPLTLPPEVPADRVKAIRDAFDATMKDPQYVADAKRIKMDISPLSGRAISDLVARIQATPQEKVDRLRQMLLPPKRN